jgi:hypothetical protein
MREPDFSKLATRLLKNGIAPRHAHRTVNELRDHYDDLVDAAVDDGASSENARRQAADRLGPMDEFVQQMASRRELKTWVFRYPWLAVVVYPIACLVALPAIPVVAGIAHRNTLARWGASFLAAGLVTAALLLTMQLSILLG